MFHRATCRLPVAALQSSLDASGHPETLSKPKYGLRSAQRIFGRQMWGLPDDDTWNVPKQAGDLLTLVEHTDYMYSWLCKLNTNTFKYE